MNGGIVKTLEELEKIVEPLPCIVECNPNFN